MFLLPSWLCLPFPLKWLKSNSNSQCCWPHSPKLLLMISLLHYPAFLVYSVFLCFSFFFLIIINVFLLHSLLLFHQHTNGLNRKTTLRSWATVRFSGVLFCFFIMVSMSQIYMYVFLGSFKELKKGELFEMGLIEIDH